MGVMLSMAIGAMTLALFNQQLAFLKIFQAQSFLTEEAPIISMHVSKLVGKADRFSLHSTFAQAQAGTNPTLAESDFLVMYFRQLNGDPPRRTILAFHDIPDDNPDVGLALFYYIVRSNGAVGAPEWYVTKTPRDVDFSTVDGLLRMQLDGPADERIIYSGSMQ